MRAPALVLAAALAGCIWAHCDYTPTDATWEDLALWQASDAPINPPTGMDVGREHVALHSIHVAAAGQGDHSPTVHYSDGALQASIEGAGHGRLATAARWLLENATRDIDVEAHVQAFLDSRAASDMEVYGERNGTWGRLEYHEYHHAVDIDPVLLLENLGVEPTARGVRQGPFQLAFDAAHKAFTLDGLHFEVDVFGSAGAGRAWPEGTPDEQVLQEIQEALHGAGLPAPASVEVQGYVC